MAILTGCIERAATQGEAERWNVLFIVADDLRTELGTYGYADMHTPNIDRLASQGRLFREAHVQVAIYNPSRMSFLTRRRPDTDRAGRTAQPTRS
jgi:iduronate 2-sulfatase